MSQFDPTKPLVMAQFRTVAGHDLQPGSALIIVDEPEAAGEVDEAMASRLWNSGIAVYADAFSPTPVETRQQEAQRLVEMEPLGGGYYSIRAPWLRKPEKIRGKVKADKVYAQIVEQGRVDMEPEDDEPEAPPVEPVEPLSPTPGSAEAPPPQPVLADSSAAAGPDEESDAASD